MLQDAKKKDRTSMTKHPGQNLYEKFMVPLGITDNQLAKSLGVNRSTLGRLLSGKQRLTLTMAAKLAAYFGVPAKWWLQMQADFDAQQIEKHPNWRQGVTPLILDPSLLVTPRGILTLGESTQPPTFFPEVLEKLPADPANGRRGVQVVRYENGSIALVGDRERAGEQGF
jgi:addiction module HigA family antidote